MIMKVADLLYGEKRAYSINAIRSELIDDVNRGITKEGKTRSHSSEQKTMRKTIQNQTI